MNIKNNNKQNNNQKNKMALLENSRQQLQCFLLDALYNDRHMTVVVA